MVLSEVRASNFRVTREMLFTLALTGTQVPEKTLAMIVGLNGHPVFFDLPKE
jgi:hypothetical protein